MKISARTRPAILLGRTTRFSVAVARGGREEIAYLPNSGRLRELLTPGRSVFLVERPGPGRKSHYDLVAVSRGQATVWVDARTPNILIGKALAASALPQFKGYSVLAREARLARSKVDFLLGNGPERCFLEVKSVTLVHRGRALFPDAPTQRGTRHLRDLAQAKREGFRAAILFVIQREDAEAFSPNDEMDREFGKALREAAREGVEVYAYACRVTPEEIELSHEIALSL